MRDDLDELFDSFEVEASTTVNASPDVVWDLVTDVTRITEFSPEVVRAEWIDADGPAPGAKFAGTNRLGDFEWTRICTVVDAVRPRNFSYVVGDRFDGKPSGTWSFVIEPKDALRATLRQRFAHARDGRSGTRLLADQDPEHAEEIIDMRRQVLERGMATTLAAIKRVLERS
jgi:uncharacterized protein YndB with AHSA1/START domain